MITEQSPVLISRDEILDMPNGIRIGKYFPVDAFAQILDEKRSDQTGVDGAHEAARLLLSESAVVIHFVDTENTRMTPWDDDGYLVYDHKTQLAFNDHDGGSESNFKILLNRYRDESDPQQQVLYSPPNEDGSASNLVFRNADFTFLNQQAEGTIYLNHLPNPLKMGGRTHDFGRQDYRFYLFGDHSTPLHFSRLFEEIDFGFSDEPYELDHYRQLRSIESMAKRRLDRAEFQLWPNGQFAGQVALLGALE